MTNIYSQLKNTYIFIISLPESITLVNTSLHGVSDAILQYAFATVGLPAYIPVPQQQYPDPEFPTVSFPNPEEKGILKFYGYYLLRANDISRSTCKLAST